MRRLVVRYSDPTAAPTHIFLKTTRLGLSPALRDIGQREVAYYRDVARYLPGGLVPRCYSAVWDDDTSRFSLLLEDLTATHAMISEWPVPPTDEQCRRIVQVYSRLHACLWDHPDLGRTIGTFIDAPLTDWFNSYQQRFAAFADHLASAVPRRRAIYERAIACGDGGRPPSHAPRSDRGARMHNGGTRALARRRCARVDWDTGTRPAHR